MLSISNPIKGAGQGHYYLNLAQEDYYTQAAEPPGKWVGRAKERLGLKEAVIPKEFLNLLKGFSPEGDRLLVQSPSGQGRQCGWDLTFSAPKYVSVLWAMSPESSRKQIEQAHAKAVEKTLGRIEGTAGISRRGKGGKIKEQAELLFATFTHHTSREHDPQLHTHGVLINAGVRKDGTTGALWTNKLFEQKMAAGKFYRDELAKELNKQLGLKIDQRDESFQIRGIPKELCEHFSKRRQQIVNELKAAGKQGAVAAKTATLKTRRAKKTQNRDQPFEQWQQAGKDLNWGREQAQQLLQSASQEIGKKQATTQFQQIPTKDKSEGQQKPEPRKQHKRQTTIPRKQIRIQNAPGLPTKSRISTSKFEYVVAREIRNIFEENRSMKRLAPIVGRLAMKHGASERVAGRVLSDLSNDPKPPFIRRKSHYVFNNAPAWSPLSRIKKQQLVVGEKTPYRRWNKIRRRSKTVFGEFRIQDRKVFPGAAKWNPLSKLKFRSLRFIPKKTSIFRQLVDKSLDKTAEHER